MVECFRCSSVFSSSDMLECVHYTGVVYVCKACYPKLRIPIIERKKVDWNSIEEHKTVRERLSNMAHVQVEEKKSNFVEKKNPEDMSLRDIVERNFDKNKLVAKEVSNELVDNFNWIIMRRRRSLKMSLNELSEKIHEPEIVVNSLEKGILPKEYRGIIRKVESVLSVRLFKDFKGGIDSEDIVVESKVPTGILLSEVKEKSKGFMDWFKKKESSVEKEKSPGLKKEELIDANKLDLEKIEDIFGKPVNEEKKNLKRDEKTPVVKKSFEEKKEDKTVFEESKGEVELSADEIDNLIWRS